MDYFTEHHPASSQSTASANLVDNLLSREIVALSNIDGAKQDLVIETSGHLISDVTDCNVIQVDGDLVTHSNLLSSNVLFVNDLNIYSSDNSNNTTSFGFQINDNEELEMYKYDSSASNATLVSVFGNGLVTTQLRGSSQRASVQANRTLRKKEDTNLNMYDQVNLQSEETINLSRSELSSGDSTTEVLFDRRTNEVYRTRITSNDSSTNTSLVRDEYNYYNSLKTTLKFEDYDYDTTDTTAFETDVLNKMGDYIDGVDPDQISVNSNEPGSIKLTTTIDHIGETDRPLLDFKKALLHNIDNIFQGDLGEISYDHNSTVSEFSLSNLTMDIESRYDINSNLIDQVKTIHKQNNKKRIERVSVNSNIIETSVEHIDESGNTITSDQEYVYDSLDSVVYEHNRFISNKGSQNTDHGFNLLSLSDINYNVSFQVWFKLTSRPYNPENPEKIVYNLMFGPFSDSNKGFSNLQVLPNICFTRVSDTEMGIRVPIDLDFVTDQDLHANYQSFYGLEASPSGANCLIYNTTYTYNEWTHVMYTSEYSVGSSEYEHKLYINGVVVDNKSTSKHPLKTLIENNILNIPFGLGYSQSTFDTILDSLRYDIGTGKYTRDSVFVGLSSNHAVWNKTMTEAEVVALYDQGRGYRTLKETHSLYADSEHHFTLNNKLYDEKNPLLIMRRDISSLGPTFVQNETTSQLKYRGELTRVSENDLGDVFTSKIYADAQLNKVETVVNRNDQQILTRRKVRLPHNGIAMLKEELAYSRTSNGTRPHKLHYVYNDDSDTIISSANYHRKIQNDDFKYNDEVFYKNDSSVGYLYTPLGTGFLSSVIKKYKDIGYSYSVWFHLSDFNDVMRILSGSKVSSVFGSNQLVVSNEGPIVEPKSYSRLQITVASLPGNSKSLSEVERNSWNNIIVSGIHVGNNVYEENFYVNGQLVNTNQNRIISDTDIEFPDSLGIQSSSSNKVAHHANYAIWSYQLSGDDITNIYNEGIGYKTYKHVYRNAIHHWPLTQHITDVAHPDYDISGLDFQFMSNEGHLVPTFENVVSTNAGLNVSTSEPDSVTGLFTRTETNPDGSYIQESFYTENFYPDSLSTNGQYNVTVELNASTLEVGQTYHGLYDKVQKDFTFEGVAQVNNDLDDVKYFSPESSIGVGEQGINSGFYVGSFPDSLSVFVFDPSKFDGKETYLTRSVLVNGTVTNDVWSVRLKSDNTLSFGNLIQDFAVPNLLNAIRAVLIVGKSSITNRFTLYLKYYDGTEMREVSTTSEIYQPPANADEVVSQFIIANVHNDGTAFNLFNVTMIDKFFDYTSSEFQKIVNHFSYHYKVREPTSRIEYTAIVDIIGTLDEYTLEITPPSDPNDSTYYPLAYQIRRTVITENKFKNQESNGWYQLEHNEEDKLRRQTLLSPLSVTLRRSRVQSLFILSTGEVTSSRDEVDQDGNVTSQTTTDSNSAYAITTTTNTNGSFEKEYRDIGSDAFIQRIVREVSYVDNSVIETKTYSDGTYDVTLLDSEGNFIDRSYYLSDDTLDSSAIDKYLQVDTRKYFMSTPNFRFIDLGSTGFNNRTNFTQQLWFKVHPDFKQSSVARPDEGLVLLMTTNDYISNPPKEYQGLELTKSGSTYYIEFPGYNFTAGFPRLIVRYEVTEADFLDKWFHFVQVHTEEGKSLMYVNGNYIRDIGDGQQGPIHNKNHTGFGALLRAENANRQTAYGNATISNQAFWLDRALTADEIGELYHSGQGWSLDKTSSALLSQAYYYWNFKNSLYPSKGGYNLHMELYDTLDEVIEADFYDVN